MVELVETMLKLHDDSLLLTAYGPGEDEITVVEGAVHGRRLTACGLQLAAFDGRSTRNMSERQAGSRRRWRNMTCPRPRSRVCVLHELHATLVDFDVGHASF